MTNFLATKLNSLLLVNLTLSWRKPLSYRNQSIDLLCKSMDLLLYDNGPRHERVNHQHEPLLVKITRSIDPINHHSTSADISFSLDFIFLCAALLYLKKSSECLTEYFWENSYRLSERLSTINYFCKNALSLGLHNISLLWDKNQMS